MLPPVALIPLAIIWFGIGEGSKYFVVLWGTVIACFFSSLDGVMNAPRARVLAARCMGASPLRVMWDVVLPSAIPSIWTGMKISIGLAFSSVVAAELVAAREGLGFLIMNARVLIEVEKLFVGLALLAFLGAVTDRLFTAVGETFLGRYLDYVRA
jgi:NitT/TauT family transport system permease protein/taurine transport system permease protein